MTKTIITETVVSDSRQPLSISNASSFDDSKFVNTCHFYGLEHAKSVSDRRGWRLSKPPESLLEDEVNRYAERYRLGITRGFAVISDELKAKIKANTFRGRK